MSFAISSSKLTGNPGDSGWAQVHDFRPEDSQKFSARGHFFAVVATKKGKEGVESVVAGRELLTRLHEEYFGKTDVSAYNALLSAVEKVTVEFKEIWGDVEIAACAVLGDVTYAACGGGAKISILRSGMLAKILDSKDDPSKNVISASGYPKNSDILILGSASFFNIFPDATLKDALSGLDPKDATEKLAPKLHSGAGLGDVGAAILKFEKGVLPKVSSMKASSEQIEPAVGKSYLSFIKRAKDKQSLFLARTRNKLTLRLSKLPEKKIFVAAPLDEVKAAAGRKFYISVGVLLLVLLIISIGFGIKQNNEKERKSRYEDRLISAQHQFEESVTLFPLDENRARELFSESNSVVNTLIQEGVSDPELTKLSEEIAKERGRILGEYEGNTELFVELSLVSDGFVGSQLAGSKDSFTVINDGADRIISTSFETKRSEVVAGPDQVEGAKTLAVYTDRVYVVKNDGVYEIGESVEKVIDADWEGEVLAYSYAGNIYILEKGAGVIKRYTAGESGFSTGANWLSPGVEPDLSGIISWAIDGSIWLLSSSGKISRYSLGNPQVFNITGISPPLFNPKAIYTSEDLESIYILDPENSRVVVIDKEGNYKAQYKEEKIKEAKDLAVSEEEKKIILLMGDKLFSIEIKHL